MGALFLCLKSLTFSAMEYTGLGGGGFMLIRSSNGTYEFIDFRETAPAAAFESMYNGNISASVFGGLARYENVHLNIQRRG